MGFGKIKIVFLLWLALAFLLSFSFFVCAQAENPVTAASEARDSRIAPGEFLPVSVKLVNFGSQKKVDVIVTYKVLDNSQAQVYSESETVAVETTASFVKRIQLPYTLQPGQYVVLTSIKYPYQEDPAQSQFAISVEKKIGGVFQGDLIFYSAALVVFIILAIVVIFFLMRKAQKHHIAYFDYSSKPKDQMIYYEILSDIIAQMRLRIGNDALEIAKDIPDLEINDKTGFIINIKKEPAKIIAQLVSRYEQLSGQKVSFSLRRNN